MTLAARNKIRAALTHRKFFWLAALAGFLIALPSLVSGLWMDDYRQRIIMLTDITRNPFDFFRPGSPAVAELLQRGVIPWWTYPETKLSFFRPVAHWLMQLDYRLWPNDIPLMHLHSVLWYAALVALTGLTYRRLMSLPLAAGFAALMFALDAGHGGAVAWLANRNAMVAMAGSMLVLLCYRRTQWYWLLAGCAIFAVTLGCAEAALAITGYLFAYEVFLSRQRWAVRMLRLLPYAVVAVLWLAFWHFHGYGSRAHGFYTDPGSEPIKFLRGLVYRAPAFLFGQLTLVPVEVFWVLETSRWHLAAWLSVLAGCAVLVKLFRPLLKESALARFYMLGMCIATIPICGSQLVSRSLWYVSFGAIGLLGLLFERYFSAPESAGPGFRRFVKTMLVLHLVISPIAFVVDTQAGKWLDNSMDTRTLHIPDAEQTPNAVLALSANRFESNVFVPLLKDEALSLGTAPRRPRPSIARFRLLTNGPGRYELWRKDENTLVASRDSGFEKMREGKYGFDAGERVALDDVVITVLAVNTDRAATEIEYRFKPGVLDSYDVIAWRGNHFVPAKLPAVGERVSVDVVPPF